VIKIKKFFYQAVGIGHLLLGLHT